MVAPEDDLSVCDSDEDTVVEDDMVTEVTKRDSADNDAQSRPSRKEIRAPRILVGVCTLNEAKNIGELIRQIRIALPTADILVIDDSSSDGTADVVRSMAEDDPSIRLKVRTRKGLGSAIRLAINASIRREYDLFINLDGDLSHSPESLPGMVEIMTREPAVDVVIGSRYVEGGKIEGWPKRRRVMSRMVNRFATTFLRLPVKDCSGSMRCYRVESMRVIAHTLVSDGYSVLEEILVALNQMNATMREVPITFIDRTEGESKLTVGEAIRSVKHMMKLAIKP